MSYTKDRDEMTTTQNMTTCYSLTPAIGVYNTHFQRGGGGLYEILAKVNLTPHLRGPVVIDEFQS